MSTRLKASLEAAIDKWIEEQCEENDWPSQLVPPSISERMTEAAYAVFMVSAESAAYTKDQG